MKNKPGKKRSKISGKKIARTGALTPVKAPSKGVAGISTVEVPPAPDLLLQEAEQEPDYRSLAVYARSIGVLRKKGFSYREIAEWFSDRGVDVDHNAVYRVYTNSLSDLDAHMEAKRENDEALEEAMRNG